MFSILTYSSVSYFSSQAAVVSWSCTNRCWKPTYASKAKESADEVTLRSWLCQQKNTQKYTATKILRIKSRSPVVKYHQYSEQNGLKTN